MKGKAHRKQSLHGKIFSKHVSNMESLDRALTCQILIKRVTVPETKEAARKWAGEL